MVEKSISGTKKKKSSENKGLGSACAGASLEHDISSCMFSEILHFLHDVKTAALSGEK